MKRAYLTKEEAIEHVQKLDDDAKITGITVTARLPHSYHQSRFGKHDTPVNVEHVPLSEVSEQFKGDAVSGKSFDQ